MSDFSNNKVILRGQISNMRKFEGRTSVLRFRITTTYERDDGQPIYSHVSCRSFGRYAEEFEETFSDGDEVYAVGRVEDSSYTNRNGDKVYEQYVTVATMTKEKEDEPDEKEEEDGKESEAEEEKEEEKEESKIVPLDDEDDSDDYDSTYDPSITGEDLDETSDDYEDNEDLPFV